MDAISEHSFIIDLSVNDEIKPTPSCNVPKKNKSKRIKIPDYYLKYEVEFYEVVSKCAEYIDKIHCRDTRIKFQNDLSKIFITRHKASAMRMFMSLVNYDNSKGGDSNGKS